MCSYSVRGTVPSVVSVPACDMMVRCNHGARRLGSDPDTSNGATNSCTLHPDFSIYTMGMVQNFLQGVTEHFTNEHTCQTIWHLRRMVMANGSLDPHNPPRPPLSPGRSDGKSKVESFAQGTN